jgi:anaerobic ribonucleoside-triphosphate reductase
MIGITENKCSKCGTVYPEGLYKCPNCGKADITIYNHIIKAVIILGALIFLLIKFLIKNS